MQEDKMFTPQTIFVIYQSPQVAAWRMRNVSTFGSNEYVGKPGTAGSAVCVCFAPLLTACGRRAALAQQWRDAVREKKWDSITVSTGPKHTFALRDAQKKELSKWAALRKYDTHYLHVAKDGVPNHFEAMDGSELRLLLSSK